MLITRPYWFLGHPLLQFRDGSTGGVSTPNWGPDPSWGVLGGGGGWKFLQKCVKKQKFCLKMRENRDSRKNLSPVCCGEQLS